MSFFCLFFVFVKLTVHVLLEPPATIKTVKCYKWKSMCLIVMCVLHHVQFSAGLKTANTSLLIDDIWDNLFWVSCSTHARAHTPVEVINQEF